MRVLLVQAPFTLSHRYGLRTEPLGLLYLAASLRAAGHPVKIFDPTIGAPTRSPLGYYYGVNDEVLRSLFAGFRPDLVGVSCLASYTVNGAYKVATLVKKLLGDRVFTVLGGVYPSVFKELALEECEAIDFALQGEADRSFPALVAELSSARAELTAVDGLIHRSDGRIVVNEKRDFIEDLDSLPFPARDLGPVDAYMNCSIDLMGLGSGRRSLSLLTSRSCPQRCSFCNMRHMHGPRWRSRSPENVILELTEMVERYRVQDVFLMDDNFALNKNRTKEICKRIIDRRLGFRWNTPNGISARGVDRELATLMKRSGCANACVAIESGSAYIRNEVMNKRVSNQQIAHAVQCLRDAGIPVGGFLILGAPGETDAHFRQTVDLVKRLPLSFITISFIHPFPSTELYDHLVEHGIIEADYGRRFRELPPNYNTPSFTTADFDEATLLHRRKELLLSFYRSHVLLIARDLAGGRLNWMTRSSVLRFVHELCGGR